MTFEDWEIYEPRARAMLAHYGLIEWRVSVENLRNPMYISTETPCGLWGAVDFGRAEHMTPEAIAAYIAASKPSEAGEQYLYEKVLRLDHRLSHSQFRQTMLHEIAHILVGKTSRGEGHGQMWVDTAIAIGCTAVEVLGYMNRP